MSDPAVHSTPPNPAGNVTVVDSTVEPSIQSSIQSEDKRRRTALWRLLIVGVLLAFFWFLIVGLNRQNTSGQRAAGVAPDFTLTTFDGETIALADLEGQGVVLNFWASWCGPCRAEADILEQTWRREQNNGIVFVGVDYLDQEHNALEFLEEYDVTYPNGPDLQSVVARSYGVREVPETFFITPDGRIDEIVIGVIPSQARLDELIDGIRPD